jgi:hypothetical protein
MYRLLGQVDMEEVLQDTVKHKLFVNLIFERCSHKNREMMTFNDLGIYGTLEPCL